MPPLRMHDRRKLAGCFERRQAIEVDGCTEQLTGNCGNEVCAADHFGQGEQIRNRHSDSRGRSDARHRFGHGRWHEPHWRVGEVAVLLIVLDANPLAAGEGMAESDEADVVVDQERLGSQSFCRAEVDGDHEIDFAGRKFVVKSTA